MPTEACQQINEQCKTVETSCNFGQPFRVLRSRATVSQSPSHIPGFLLKMCSVVDPLGCRGCFPLSSNTFAPPDRHIIKSLLKVLLWCAVQQSLDICLESIDIGEPATTQLLFESWECPKIARCKVWAVSWVHKEVNPILPIECLWTLERGKPVWVLI